MPVRTFSHRLRRFIVEANPIPFWVWNRINDMAAQKQALEA